MTVPPTTTTTLFSTTWAAEPLIWTSFLAVSTWQFAQPPSTSWLDILFWLLLWVVTSRAWVLVRKPEGVTATSDEVWRRPAPEKQVSDAGGIFWSLVLVPLVCLAVGAQSTGDADLWRLHAVAITLLTYSGWEKRGLLLLLAALLVVSSWNYNDLQDTIESANLCQLLLLWVALYYSMPGLSSHFHGVFTQGEWMVVTSLTTLAFTQYTTCALQEPTHATVAMAGLLSVLATCPIMQVIKRIKFEDSTVISSELLTLLFQLPIWIGLPLAGVEGLEFYWLRQSTSLPTVPAVVAENLPVSIPKSLLWLIGFLLETETPLLTTSLPSLPRFGWLLYWLVVLIHTIPFAPTQQDDDSSTSIHKVVLMRKWFHGIAVLLFGPVTLAAPQLLSLSYAIAWAILILFESARSSLPMIASFHERYLDPSKDHAQRLVISHMALIVGCALPLWMAEWVGNALPPALLALLALWGVLSLGIGDAMGAIVGVHMGRIQWSTHNSRTLEGSLAMWTSLAVSCWALVEFVVGEDFATLQWPCLATITFVTLLEAHTFQVDNLVLPLAGAASLLLLTTSIP